LPVLAESVFPPPRLLRRAPVIDVLQPMIETAGFDASIAPWDAQPLIRETPHLRHLNRAQSPRLHQSPRRVRPVDDSSSCC